MKKKILCSKVDLTVDLSLRETFCYSVLQMCEKQISFLFFATSANNHLVTSQRALISSPGHVTSCFSNKWLKKLKPYYFFADFFCDLRILSNNQITHLDTTFLLLTTSLKMLDLFD